MRFFNLKLNEISEEKKKHRDLLIMNRTVYSDRTIYKVTVTDFLNKWNLYLYIYLRQAYEFSSSGSGLIVITIE